MTAKFHLDVLAGKCVCPFCGNTDSTKTQATQEGREAIYNEVVKGVQMQCQVCGAVWEEFYTLTNLYYLEEE